MEELEREDILRSGMDSGGKSEDKPIKAPREPTVEERIGIKKK